MFAACDDIDAGGRIEQFLYWTYARSVFHEARPVHPELGHRALAYVGRVYAVEWEFEIGCLNCVLLRLLVNVNRGPLQSSNALWVEFQDFRIARCCLGFVGQFG